MPTKKGWHHFSFYLLAAATATVVATAVIGDAVVWATVTVTIAANQEDDNKDNNPWAVITVIEEATHS